ncbi:MAG TPA: M48 family metallopeptidase [Acidimicrobiales bacterium]|nr:M48 family metallopeptidase [Acidimicrobiales bacterium]
MSLQESVRYEQISPKAYEHPADRAATAALRSIPMLDKVVKTLTDIYHERLLRQVLTGNSVQISDRQVPQLWAKHVRAASVLDIDKVPDLFVTQMPIGNAFTIGAKRPMVVILSGLARDYSGGEVDAVLAHEMSHVLSQHYYYQSALEFLRQMVQTATGAPGFLPGIPLRAVYLVMLEWWRKAELSADRASALVVGDPLVPCQMLMRIAGGALEGMSLDAFLAQAAAFEDEEDMYARWSRTRWQAWQSHPFAVRRTRELMKWVNEGSYDRIRDGAYIRRGQEPPAPRELDAAVAHYQERFVKILETATGGIERALGQLEGWLRPRSSSPGGAAAGASGAGDPNKGPRRN